MDLMKKVPDGLNMRDPEPHPGQEHGQGYLRLASDSCPPGSVLFEMHTGRNHPRLEPAACANSLRTGGMIC